MTAMRAALCRLAGLFRRSRRDADLEAELDAHVQLVGVLPPNFSFLTFDVTVTPAGGRAASSPARTRTQSRSIAVRRRW
jgi:hypothetical protein